MRQTKGPVGPIIGLLGLNLAVPDHSTLSRRAATVEVPRPRRAGEPLHLLVDSTGLKLCDAGEWLVEKHGTKTRRSWRTLHLRLDADTGQSIAKHGRAAWQTASGYTKRARAEAAVGRFKQVIGNGLRARTDERRATEVNVAVHALNRTLEFGRPISIRIA